jgi:hypothetical protein
MNDQRNKEEEKLYQDSFKNNKTAVEKISTSEILLLSFVVLGLLGFLGYFFYDSSVLIGSCRNNVPVENCNNPAGDFAVEPDARSTNIESGCGADQKSPCIFQNISTVSEAIKQCNSLGNKCNRFMFNNNTMTVVSLVGDTIESPGNHMFVRQNGITFQGQGNPSNTFNNSFVPGESSSITSTSNNPTASTLSSLFSGLGVTSSTPTTSSGGY